MTVCGISLSMVQTQLQGKFLELCHLSASSKQIVCFQWELHVDRAESKCDSKGFSFGAICEGVWSEEGKGRPL